eukprot:365365-Chlamydomonas_euryale.AAC.2
MAACPPRVTQPLLLALQLPCWCEAAHRRAARGVALERCRYEALCAVAQPRGCARRRPRQHCLDCGVSPGHAKWRPPDGQLEGKHAHRPRIDLLAVSEVGAVLVVRRERLVGATQHLWRLQAWARRREGGCERVGGDADGLRTGCQTMKEGGRRKNRGGDTDRVKAVTDGSRMDMVDREWGRGGWAGKECRCGFCLGEACKGK